MYIHIHTYTYKLHIHVHTQAYTCHIYIHGAVELRNKRITNDIRSSWRNVLGSRKSSKTFPKDEYPQRITRCHQRIDTKIKLKAIDEKWLETKIHKTVWYSFIVNNRFAGLRHRVWWTETGLKIRIITSQDSHDVIWPISWTRAIYYRITVIDSSELDCRKTSEPIEKPSYLVNS